MFDRMSSVQGSARCGGGSTMQKCIMRERKNECECKKACYLTKTATRTMNGTYVTSETAAMIRHRLRQDFASVLTVIRRTRREQIA